MTLKDYMVMDDAGFYVFWPKGLNGFLTAKDLRDMADKMDAMNKPWEAILNRQVEITTNDL